MRTTQDNATQHENNTTARDNTNTMRHNTNTARPNTSTKESRAAKIGLHIVFFVTELYIFLAFLEIFNIVLHVILFQPFEYRGLKTRPSEMLSNQGHMAPCAKLSSLPDIKLRIAIQVPKMYRKPLFRVLSTTSTAPENKYLATKWKSRIKLEKVVMVLKYISNSFLPA